MAPARRATIALSEDDGSDFDGPIGQNSRDANAAKRKRTPIEREASTAKGRKARARDSDSENISRAEPPHKRAKSSKADTAETDDELTLKQSTSVPGTVESHSSDPSYHLQFPPGTEPASKKTTTKPIKGLTTLYKTSPRDGTRRRAVLGVKGLSQNVAQPVTPSRPVAKAKAPIKAKDVAASSSSEHDAVVPAVATKKSGRPPAATAKVKPATKTPIKREPTLDPPSEDVDAEDGITASEKVPVPRRTPAPKKTSPTSTAISVEVVKDGQAPPAPTKTPKPPANLSSKSSALSSASSSSAPPAPTEPRMAPGPAAKKNPPPPNSTNASTALVPSKTKPVVVRVPPVAPIKDADDSFDAVLEGLVGPDVEFVETGGKSVSWDTEAVKKARSDLVNFQKLYDTVRDTVGPAAEEKFEKLKQNGEEREKVHKQELEALRERISHLESGLARARTERGNGDDDVEMGDVSGSGSSSAPSVAKGKDKAQEQKDQEAKMRKELEKLRAEVSSMSNLRDRLSDLERVRRMYEDLTGVKVTSVEVSPGEDGEEQDKVEGSVTEDFITFTCEQKLKGGTLHYDFHLPPSSDNGGGPQQYWYIPTEETRTDAQAGRVPPYTGQEMKFAKSN
ncbi:hypothetical protein HDU93_000840, partial [Gonapodya sp. JEL0774]